MAGTTRNVFPTMAKLDFSSLKTADLRSVAPVDENAIPRAQQASENEVPVSVSLPQVSAAPVSAIEAPAHVPAAPSSHLPHVPAAPVARTAPAVHASKKISLTSLRGGGPSAVSHAPSAPVASAPVASVSEPIAARTPTVAVSTASKRSATTISLGTKPAVQAPAQSQEAPVAAEMPVTDAALTASETVVEPLSEDGRALIEGVDIIQAAKVIGTEGEALANEILTESLKDPEAVRREAEEKAVAAVVIPETEKVFFPNLEMDDDFFDDPLFEGIVPAKPEKKPEVRQPLEMKKEEPVAQAVAAESAPVELTEADSGVSANEPTEVVANESERAVAETSPAESEAVVTPAVSEIAVQETAAVEKTDSVTSAEAESPSQIPAEAYVETVAKEISAERKGGLSKLFGERKVLVRAMAGFFAVAVLGVGAFQLVPMSIKTSGPEAMNTGSELPKYVPTGETKIIGEGVRVHTGRRPNVHKNKKALPVTNSGAVAWSWAVSDSGTVAPPVSESGSDVGSGTTASGAEIPGPVQFGSGSLEVSAGAAAPEKISWESPVPTDLPANSGAVEALQPIEAPAAQADMPQAPVLN